MTSARFKPMLFTSIWTSSAPGGGTSRFSIFSTLASPYSWKRTMRAIISPLFPFAIFVAIKPMPQIHFAFEHLGQHLGKGRREGLYVRQFEMHRKIRTCLPVLIKNANIRIVVRAVQVVAEVARFYTRGATGVASRRRFVAKPRLARIMATRLS